MRSPCVTPAQRTVPATSDCAPYVNFGAVPGRENDPFNADSTHALGDSIRRVSTRVCAVFALPGGFTFPLPQNSIEYHIFLLTKLQITTTLYTALHSSYTPQ